MTEGVDWLLPVLALALAAGAVWIQRRRASALWLVAGHCGWTAATATAIGLMELLQAASAAAAATGLVQMEQAAADFRFFPALLAVLGTLTAAAVLSLSLIVLARLWGAVGACRFPGQRGINRLLWLAAGVLCLMTVLQLEPRLIAACALVGLVLGIGVALPLASSSLPQALWSSSALAGLSLAFAGYAGHSPAVILSGVVVCVAGVMQVTRAMAPSNPRPSSRN